MRALVSYRFCPEEALKSTKLKVPYERFNFLYSFSPSINLFTPQNYICTTNVCVCLRSYLYLRITFLTALIGYKQVDIQRTGIFSGPWISAQLYFTLISTLVSSKTAKINK